MSRVRTRSVEQFGIAMASLDYETYGPLMADGGWCAAMFQSHCEGCGLPIFLGDKIQRVTRQGTNRPMWAHFDCVEKSFRVHPRWLNAYREWVKTSDSPWILLYVIREPMDRVQCSVCGLYGKNLAVVRKFQLGGAYIKRIAACCMTKEGAISDDT
jgi:hypothetical protein